MGIEIEREKQRACVMGSEEETEQNSIPRLLLLSKPHAHGHMQSPERSGMLTPPHHTSASVPFRWEEEPGKPRGCTALSHPIDLAQKCLELPPRLLLMDASSTVAKLPLPTTVLEVAYMGKPRFQSSSFRIIRREWYGSFRRSCSPERAQLGAMVLSKRRVKEGRGFLGSWGWGRKGLSKREIGGGSHVFPSSVDREADGSNEEEESDNNKEVTVTKIRRTGSFSSLSHSRPQFWATIYEGLKQVVPWRGRQLKKDDRVI